MTFQYLQERLDHITWAHSPKFGLTSRSDVLKPAKYAKMILVWGFLYVSSFARDGYKAIETSSNLRESSKVDKHCYHGKFSR